MTQYNPKVHPCKTASYINYHHCCTCTLVLRLYIIIAWSSRLYTLERCAKRMKTSTVSVLHPFNISAPRTAHTNVASHQFLKHRQKFSLREHMSASHAVCSFTSLAYNFLSPESSENGNKSCISNFLNSANLINITNGKNALEYTKTTFCLLLRSSGREIAQHWHLYRRETKLDTTCHPCILFCYIPIHNISSFYSSFIPAKMQLRE